MSDETKTDPTPLSDAYWSPKAIVTAVFVAITVVFWSLTAYQNFKAGAPIPAPPTMPALQTPPTDPGK